MTCSHDAASLGTFVQLGVPGAFAFAGGLSAPGSACSLGAGLQGSCKKLTRAIMSHMRTSSPSRLSSIEHDTGMQLGLLQYKPQMPEGHLSLVIAHPSCLKQLTAAIGATAQVRCLHSVCTFKTAASRSHWTSAQGQHSSSPGNGIDLLNAADIDFVVHIQALYILSVPLQPDTGLGCAEGSLPRGKCRQACSLALELMAEAGMHRFVARSAWGRQP